MTAGYQPALKPEFSRLPHKWYFCRKASTRSDLLPQTRMAIVHVYPGDSSEIVRLRAGFEQKIFL